MKLGVIGGTFDPIHNGHLFIAEEARCRFDLEKVIFVPSFAPPHKRGVEFSPPADRLAMVRMAIEGNAAFEASSLEIERGGVSYTVDTLRELRMRNPDNDFYFITGADAIVEILTWKEPERVMALAEFIVAARRGFPLENIERALPALVEGKGAMERVIVMESPLIDISASEIRERVAAGLPVRYLLPEAVRRYVEDRGLYRKV